MIFDFSVVKPGSNDGAPRPDGDTTADENVEDCVVVFVVVFVVVVVVVVVAVVVVPVVGVAAADAVVITMIGGCFLVVDPGGELCLLLLAD